MSLLSRNKRKGTAEAEAEREAELTAAVSAAVADTAGEDTTPAAALIEPEATTAARLSGILNELNVQNRIDAYNQELSAVDDEIRALLNSENTHGKLAIGLSKALEKAHSLSKDRDNLAGAFKFVQQIDVLTDQYKQLADNTLALTELRLRAQAVYRQISLEEMESRHTLENSARSLSRAQYNLRKDPQVAEADLDRISRAIQTVKDRVTPILKATGQPPQI